jgi:hypothetical protein
VAEESYLKVYVMLKRQIGTMMINADTEVSPRRCGLRIENLIPIMTTYWHGSAVVII